MNTAMKVKEFHRPPNHEGCQCRPLMLLTAHPRLHLHQQQSKRPLQEVYQGRAIKLKGGSNYTCASNL